MLLIQRDESVMSRYLMHNDICGSRLKLSCQAANDFAREKFCFVLVNTVYALQATVILCHLFRPTLVADRDIKNA